MPPGQVLGVSTWPLDLAGQLVAALRGGFRGGSGGPGPRVRVAGAV